MGKRKKEATEIVPAESHAMVKVQPAEIVEPDLIDEGANIPLPEMARGGKLAASSLTPVFEFPSIGSFAAGIFRGVRYEIGPNKSRIYDLEYVTGQVASVWGSTSLDQMFDINYGDGSSIKGKFVTIQYLGTKETQRGLNPVKLWRIAVK